MKYSNARQRVDIIFNETGIQTLELTHEITVSVDTMDTPLNAIDQYNYGKIGAIPTFGFTMSISDLSKHSRFLRSLQFTDTEFDMKVYDGSGSTTYIVSEVFRHCKINSISHEINENEPVTSVDGIAIEYEFYKSGAATTPTKMLGDSGYYIDTDEIMDGGDLW